MSDAIALRHHQPGRSQTPTLLPEAPKGRACTSVIDWQLVMHYVARRIHRDNRRGIAVLRCRHCGARIGAIADVAGGRVVVRLTDNAPQDFAVLALDRDAPPDRRRGLQEAARSALHLSCPNGHGHRPTASLRGLYGRMGHPPGGNTKL